MKVLFFIFVISMILVAVSENLSVANINSNNDKIYVKKEIFFYFVMTLVMAVLVGLRIKYNDTINYIDQYEYFIDADGPVFSLLFRSIGENPGFVFVLTIMKHLGMSTQSFLMVFALITNGIYLWFIRKHSDDIWLSVFLFFTMGCYTFTMAAIKQCFAVALCLIATDKAIRKKYVAFVFWVFLAILFHPYALMYLIVPFLDFIPWTRKTFLFLGIAAVAGVTLQRLVGTIISITTMMGEEYEEYFFTGAGVNIFRLAVIWAPIIVSFLASKQLRCRTDRRTNIIFNLTMLNAEIMFIALFGTANFFARLANYFLIFQTLFVPWVLRKCFDKNTRFILCCIVMVCYFGYFYYANVIDKPFDQMFQYIPLGDYLNTLQ